MHAYKHIVPKMGCQSACQDVIYQCNNIFMLTGKGSLPDCNKKSPLTGQPLSSDTTNCNAIAPMVANPHVYYNLSAVMSRFVMSECPPPFLKDPMVEQGVNKTSNNIYCHAGCCIPCPAQNYVCSCFIIMVVFFSHALLVLSQWMGYTWIHGY